MNSRVFFILLIAGALVALTSFTEAIAFKFRGANKMAKYLESHAKTLHDGSYLIRNAKTGQYLTFYGKGNDLRLFPKGKGGDMGSESQIFRVRPHKVKHHNHLHSVHHFNKHNEKCLSAAWGSSSDNFAPMFACRIDLIRSVHHRHITSPHGSIPNDKQIWFFVPGHKKGAFRIITLAHIFDFKPRCLFPEHHEGRGAMGHYTGLWLNECPGIGAHDPRYEWFIQKV